MDYRINRFNAAATLGLLGSCVLACTSAPSRSGSAGGASTSSNAGAAGGAAEGGGLAAGGGATSTGSGAATGQAGDAAGARIDITAAILGNQDLALVGNSVAKLPPGTTTYTGVISGQGTLRLVTADGSCAPSTWIITRPSTFTLPNDQQLEVVTKAGPWPAMGYRLDIAGSNPPVLIIDPCIAFQIGTNTTADDNPNIIASVDHLNAASVVNGEINLDNIQNDGVIALASSQFILLGEISGSGSITELPNVWGGDSPRGTSSFSGVLALSNQECCARSAEQPGPFQGRGRRLPRREPDRALT
jgi:hypothetical protein